MGSKLGPALQFSLVQSLSCIQPFVTPWIVAHQAPLSITNSQSLLKRMSIKLVMPSNHLILFHPPSSCLQSFPASGSFQMSQFFASKVLEFQLHISPFSEYSGLISFRMDWLDLFAVQETLKSLLQHHSSKASILRLSGVFIVQLSHSYLTTGKNIALTMVDHILTIMDLCWQSNISAF